MKTCYQCGREVEYLFNDGRCHVCTRQSKEEVIGHRRYTNWAYRFRAMQEATTKRARKNGRVRGQNMGLTPLDMLIN